MDDLKRRARGSLLGAAIGDAMGAPVEGVTAEAIREQYGAITDFVTGESVGTDDTDFTLFNAHILLTHGVDVTLDETTGEVTFTPLAVPGAGRKVTAGFEFDVPVRFETDRLEINVMGFRHGAIPSIPIVEVRL